MWPALWRVCGPGPAWQKRRQRGSTARQGWPPMPSSPSLVRPAAAAAQADAAEQCSHPLHAWPRAHMHLPGCQQAALRTCFRLQVLHPCSQTCRSAPRTWPLCCRWTSLTPTLASPRPWARCCTPVSGRCCMLEGLRLGGRGWRLHPSAWRAGAAAMRGVRPCTACNGDSPTAADSWSTASTKYDDFAHQVSRADFVWRTCGCGAAGFPSRPLVLVSRRAAPSRAPCAPAAGPVCLRPPRPAHRGGSRQLWQPGLER